MAEVRKITLFVLMLSKIHFVFSINKNENNTVSTTWMTWGRPYGCREGFVAVNYQNNKPVKGACVPMSYDHQNANLDSVTNVYISLEYVKLLSVDECDKTLTFDAKTSSLWADPQITMTLSENTSYISIGPDITLPNIWLPITLDFIDMKTSKPRLDPFLFTEIQLFLDDAISLNSTIIKYTSEFRITFYCDFDFRQFPFDTQLFLKTPLK